MSNGGPAEEGEEGGTVCSLPGLGVSWRGCEGEGIHPHIFSGMVLRTKYVHKAFANIFARPAHCPWQVNVIRFLSSIEVDQRKSLTAAKENLDSVRNT